METKDLGKKIVTKLATRYGTVIDGLYAGDEVILGNDPSDTTAKQGTFKQIIFIKDKKEEEARLNITSIILHIESIDSDGIICTLMYEDAKTSTLKLFYANKPSGVFGFLLKLGTITNPPKNQNAADKAYTDNALAYQFLDGFVTSLDKESFIMAKEWVESLGLRKPYVDFWKNCEESRKKCNLDEAIETKKELYGF